MTYKQKDQSFEELLQRMNSALEHEFGDAQVDSDLPTVQIVGLPRSGTTILYQLLARTGVFGYPSNVMAFFWRTPWVGASLQRQLAQSRSTVTLRSMAGRTPEPLDPHEFGYFWRNALGHAANTMDPNGPPLPAAELRRQLNLVTSTFERPTVYKNFLAPRHLPYFESVGSQRYIVIERPVTEVAASLLLTRRRLDIPADAWFGPIPPAAPTNFTSVVHRVAWQVNSLQAILESSGIARQPTAITMHYEELCRNTHTTIAELCLFCGVSLSSDHEVPATLDVSLAIVKLPAEERTELLDTLQAMEGG